MPIETETLIMEKLPPTNVLMVDALSLEGLDHPPHYNLRQALELVCRQKPKCTFLVGMSCDRFLPHDDMNRELMALDARIEFAYGGLLVEML